MPVPRGAQRAIVPFAGRGYTIGAVQNSRAMEFAITVPAHLLELMTPGCRAAPGVFGFASAADWSYVAADPDCGLWRCWNAGALWSAGFRAGTHRRNFPVRHTAHQFERMLFTRTYWAVHAESAGDFSGLARGDCRRFFRRVHNFFQLWLGDREDVGGRRVAAGDHVRRGERRRWIAAVRCRDSVGEPVLGAWRCRTKNLKASAH
jgi:hypothetical protein